MPSETCEVCGVSVMEVTLHRACPKGVRPARWRCEGCMDRPIDPDVLAVTDVIDLDNEIRGVNGEPRV